MSSAQGKKLKTNIPVAKHTAREGGGDGEVVTARSQTSNKAPKSQPSGQREQPPQPQQSSQHPLAKAMAKKPKTKKHQSSETWADEKIESQSQKMKYYNQTEQKRRKEDMEKHLREVEEQLVTMTELLEEREKMMKEAQEEAEKKTETLEQKLMDQDGCLIENGIDPVTGEKIVLDEEGQRKVESTKKFTKKRIQEMREKLQQMNRQTESYLSDIENTMQYLESLEVASERAGPLSEETRKMFGEINNEEEFIAQVYKENQQPQVPSKIDSRQTPSRQETRDAGDEEEEEDNNEQRDDGSKFFLTHVDDDVKSKDNDDER